MIEVPDPSEPTDPGPLWTRVDLEPRIGFTELKRSQVPAEPGVYAIYKDGARVYVGRACGRNGLQGRLGTHYSRGVGLRRTGFRRNVATYLGIDVAGEIDADAELIAQADAKRIRAWIESCQVTWIVFATREEARHAEDLLKIEYRPPLAEA